jgi:hypothetical protein
LNFSSKNCKYNIHSLRITYKYSSNKTWG